MSDLTNPAAPDLGAILARNPLAATTTAPKPTVDEAAARAAAEEFEAVFLAQMMAHMFEGISTDGPFGGGQAEQVYRSLLTNEYGRLATASGGLGIADQVMSEILKIQEAQG